MPHGAPSRLYDAPQSTCSQRVRFVLHAKGLWSTGSTCSQATSCARGPEAQCQRRGAGLVHDGAPVIDSAVIMEYLEEVFLHRRTFMPADLLSRARIRALIRFIDEVPAAAIRVPSCNLAFLPHFQTMSEEAFRALADAKPLRREFRLRMGRTGFSEADMNEALDRLRRGAAAHGRHHSRIRWPVAARHGHQPCRRRGHAGRAHGRHRPRPLVVGQTGRRPLVPAIRGDPAFAPTYDAGLLLTEKYRTSERARRRIGP